MSRGLLVLIFLFVFGCARQPIRIPEDLWTSFPYYRALVSYRLHLSGKTYRGRAILLAQAGRLYAEGFSPFGGALFSLWLEGGRLTWILYPQGKAARFILVPESPRLSELWPYFLLGKIPRSLRDELMATGRLSLGKGYSLKLGSSPFEIELAYLGRSFLKVWPEGPRVRLSLGLIRGELELKIKRFEAIREEIPLPPALPETVLDLRQYLRVSGD